MKPCSKLTLLAYIIFPLLIIAAFCLWLASRSWLLSLIVFLVLIIYTIVLIAKNKLNNYNWYKEWMSKEYPKYLDLYYLYQKEVCNQSKNYHIFVNDFGNSNTPTISIQANSYGNIYIKDSSRTNKCLGRMIDLLSNRKDLVDKYFQKERFSYSDFQLLENEYDKAPLTESANSEESILTHIIEYVIHNRNTKGKRTVADRLFGYYLKSIGLIALTAKQCEEEWNKYFIEYEPCDKGRYIRTPDYFCKEAEQYTIRDTLEKIKEFYASKNKHEISEIIERDIKRLIA